MNQKQRDKMYSGIEEQYPRCHYNEDKSVKRGFNSERSAKRWLERKGLTERFDVYLCDVCAQWHLATSLVWREKQAEIKKQKKQQKQERKAMEQQVLNFDERKDWNALTQEEKNELYKSFIVFNIVALGAQSHYYIENCHIDNVQPSDFTTGFVAYLQDAIAKAEAPASAPEQAAEVDNRTATEKSKDAFFEYIKELHATYKATGRLKDVSLLAKKYGVRAMTIQCFYEFGIYLQDEITYDLAMDVRSKCMKMYKEDK